MKFVGGVFSVLMVMCFVLAPDAPASEVTSVTPVKQRIDATPTL